MSIEKLMKEAREEAGNISIEEFPVHNQKCQILIDKALAEFSNLSSREQLGSTEVDITYWQDIANQRQDIIVRQAAEIEELRDAF